MSGLDEALRHCEDLVREHDNDRYVATLFAPADKRASLLALYAFDLETAAIVQRVREPLAGEVRLQWWREVLDGQRAEEAQANPVAAALLEALRRAELSAAALQDLLDAHADELYADSAPTLEATADNAVRTHGAVLQAAAQILAPGTDVSSGSLREASTAAHLTDVLRKFPADAAHSRVRIPAEVLARRSASLEEITTGRDSPGLREALSKCRDLAAMHFEQFLGHLPTIAPVARPAFLRLAVVPLYLAAARRDRQPFAPLQVPQWRRQWRIWRAARRWSRA